MAEVDLEVIDVHQQPALAARDQIVAAPTLVRRVPRPARRIVGDLGRSAWLQLGLDLGPAESQRRRPEPGRVEDMALSPASEGHRSRPPGNETGPG